jgi:Na+-transporting methylmalonyl-CoA/oxaloacetate decarboxylase gamma subunit
VLKATWFVLAGMGIVFATLTVLMLALMALNRLLSPTPEAKDHAEGRAHARRARTSRAADA